MAKKLFYITNPRRFELPNELQRLLVKAKVLQPGIETNLDSGATEYFRGLRDAKIDGAQEVMDALVKNNGKITLIVENE